MSNQRLISTDGGKTFLFRKQTIKKGDQFNVKLYENIFVIESFDIDKNNKNKANGIIAYISRNDRIDCGTKPGEKYKMKSIFNSNSYNDIYNITNCDTPQPPQKPPQKSTTKNHPI
jgi:hypothetical protein